MRCCPPIEIVRGSRNAHEKFRREGRRRLGPDERVGERDDLKRGEHLTALGAPPQIVDLPALHPSRMTDRPSPCRRILPVGVARVGGVKSTLRGNAVARHHEGRPQPPRRGRTTCSRGVRVRAAVITNANLSAVEWPSESFARSMILWRYAPNATVRSCSRGRKILEEVQKGADETRVGGWNRAATDVGPHLDWSHRLATVPDPY